MISNADVGVTKDGKICLQTDVESRWGLVGKGCFIDDATAQQYGLLGSKYDASCNSLSEDKPELQVPQAQRITDKSTKPEKEESFPEVVAITSGEFDQESILDSIGDTTGLAQEDIDLYAEFLAEANLCNFVNPNGMFCKSTVAPNSTKCWVHGGRPTVTRKPTVRKK